MKTQAGAIGPSELKEVAGLIKQAASVIDQMVDLNATIDNAAASAISQYRTEARTAHEAHRQLLDSMKSKDNVRENLVATLTERVRQLEELVEKQRAEIEGLRKIIWPGAAAAAAKKPK